MKFAIITLACLASLASASELRLPLPGLIRTLHPHLENEMINTNAPFVRVVGGNDAGNGDAPYQIAMIRSGSFICGGSLIGSQTVLTAAHCVHGYENNPSVFNVRYGTNDRTRGPTVAVKKVNRHPQYDSYTIDYDVATFVLSEPFTPSANAAVIPLATSVPADGSSLILTGWGRLSSGGTLPTKLQKATELKVVPKTTCAQAWSSVNSITNRMLCAHSKKQSACNGDSGGPLIQGNVQVGVVSWGSSSCLHATYPNVYANVANLRSWIQANS